MLMIDKPSLEIYNAEAPHVEFLREAELAVSSAEDSDLVGEVFDLSMARVSECRKHLASMEALRRDKQQELRG